jgi:hypothetical protein
VTCLKWGHPKTEGGKMSKIILTAFTVRNWVQLNITKTKIKMYRKRIIMRAWWRRTKGPLKILTTAVVISVIIGVGLGYAWRMKQDENRTNNNIETLKEENQCLKEFNKLLAKDLSKVLKNRPYIEKK